MPKEAKSGFVLAFALLLAFVVLSILAFGLGQARSAEWSSDPSTRDFFQHLMQPDNIWMSCCGEADAYFADSFTVAADGSYVAIITDDRDDIQPCSPSPSYEGDGSDEDCIGGFRTRQHRPVGSRIYVPAAKVGCTKPNPTGHGLLFMPQIGTPQALAAQGYDPVTQDRFGKPLIPYCYCPPTMGKLDDGRANG